MTVKGVYIGTLFSLSALRTHLILLLKPFLAALLTLISLLIWPLPVTALDTDNNWLAQAQSLERQKNWPALLYLGHQWSNAERDNPLAWFVLGRAYAELKRYPEAIDAYQRNLRVDPLDRYAHNNLGNSHYALKQFPEAMAAYRAAVHADPDYLLAWRNLGQTFYELKGPAGVAQALQKLRATDPALAEAWRRLAATYALTRNGRVEQQALQVLRGLSPGQRERMFAILLEGV